MLYDQLPDAVKTAPAKSLAVEMFNHVHGHCDASCMWEEYIEPSLKDSENGLGLTPVSTLGAIMGISSSLVVPLMMALLSQIQQPMRGLLGN